MRNIRGEKTWLSASRLAGGADQNVDMADDDEFQSAEVSFVTPISADVGLPAPNLPLPVYDGQARVSQGSTTITGAAQVEIRWTPVPQLTCRFEPSTPNSLQELRFGESAPVLLGVGESLGPAKIRGGQTYSAEGRPWLALRLYEPLTVDHGGEATELRFEIVNLEAYVGKPIRYGANSWRAGRLALQSTTWIVDVDDIEDLDRVEEELSQTGGFAVTHIGRAAKRDGSVITVDDAKALMTTLQYSLSLAETRWVTPVRPRARAADGSIAWEVWGLWYTSPWATPITWWRSDSATALEELFPLIDDRWSDRYWERLLRSAVHYYLDATHGLVNRQLIMGASLLELVGWHVIVEMGRIKTASAYDSLTAAERIQLLLERLAVSTEVPNELKALKTQMRRSHWANGPAAVAGVRHTATHAKRHQGGWEWDPDVWTEANLLCSHYCDLAVLGLLGYRGRFVNRVTARFTADAQPVPWSS